MIENCYIKMKGKSDEMIFEEVKRRLDKQKSEKDRYFNLGMIYILELLALDGKFEKYCTDKYC